MKKISFTLQDAPDFWTTLVADLPLGDNDDYIVKEETAIAILLKYKFPQLRNHHRRIKNLIVVDEKGNTYFTDDFDNYGSLTKKKDEAY